MPREYTDEEKATAEMIKAHWKRFYKAWYKEVKEEGEHSLNGWALNWAWDMLQHARAYEAGGMCRAMAENEAWYGMDMDSRVVDKQARREARAKKRASAMST